MRHAQEQARSEHERLQFTEAQLRDSQQRYADLFEYAPVGYVTLDSSGTVKDINAAGAQLLGSSRAAVCGSLFSSHVTPRDEARFWEHLTRCAESSEQEVVELTLGRRGTHSLPVQLITGPAAAGLDGNRELRSTMVDLSDLKRAQTALQCANDQLEFRVQERTAELLRANEILSAYISRGIRIEADLLEISEREKRLIGQDLHDETCQSLAGLSLLARVIARELTGAPQDAQAKMEALSNQLRALVEQTRSIARGLHPVELSGGLVPALRELTERADGRARCTLQADGETALSETEAVALYRIAQEAIQNATRHAQASNILVTLRRDKRLLLLSVEDDGVGLPAAMQLPRSDRGMGLDIMGCRARSINAQLTVERCQRSGTRVACLLPLSSPAKRSRVKLVRDGQGAL